MMNITARHDETPLLEIRNLSLSFQHQSKLAVDRLSLKLTAGKTLGLVGSSGAGKSSVARAIMQLVEADSGQILFKGDDILHMGARQRMATRQRMQLVFQEPSASLSPKRTVKQTLLEPLNHFVIGDAASRQAKILSTLETVGLDSDVLRRYPHQFSSGQQQRIAIARALVTNPDLLIADEAVSSLDVSVQAQILQLIQTLQKQHAITILFISHDLAVIRRIADEVAVMYRGQLMEHSSADRFFGAPAHPYSKALLSFARNEGPARVVGDQWQLDRGRNAGTGQTACLFAENCPDKINICEQLEPANHSIGVNNGNAAGPHCVKCHLYNESGTDDD